jgi:hypothetical protein
MGQCIAEGNIVPGPTAVSSVDGAGIIASSGGLGTAIISGSQASIDILPALQINTSGIVTGRHCLVRRDSSSGSIADGRPSDVIRVARETSVLLENTR